MSLRRERDIDALEDIIQAIQEIFEYVQGVDRLQLGQNREKQSAILFQIIVIGEATKRISREFRSEHPEVPWREMAGIRDVIVHNYDTVELEITWNVIQKKLPELLTLLTPLMPFED